MRSIPPRRIDRLLASFFVEASKQLAKPEKRIPSSITRLYSNASFEAFGLLCFGLHDWEIGDAEQCQPDPRFLPQCKNPRV